MDEYIEAIISQKLWDKCLEVERSSSRGKRCKAGLTLPLSGSCYCADCGCKMRQAGLPSAYVCGMYRRAGKEFCGTHYIRVESLEKIVLDDIRSKIALTVDEEKARAIFLAYKEGRTTHQTAEDNKRMRDCEHRPPFANLVFLCTV